jgi:hypothetical protein
VRCASRTDASFAPTMLAWMFDTFRPTASHRGVTTAEEHLYSFPHTYHTSMGVPVAPSLSSGPALTPPGWCLGLSVPLRPLPILWHAQGWGRGRLKTSCATNVARASTMPRSDTTRVGRPGCQAAGYTGSPNAHLIQGVDEGLVYMQRVPSGGRVAYGLSLTGLIACKDGSLGDAFPGSWTPRSTFYKLREIERPDSLSRIIHYRKVHHQRCPCGREPQYISIEHYCSH